MHKAIIFDFDGVITNGIPFHDRAYLEVLKNYGVTVSMDYLHSKIGMTPREVLTAIVREHNVPVDPDLITRQHLDLTTKLYRNEAEPTPHLADFLERCQQAGLLIGVASSTHSDILTTVLEKFGVRNYFSGLIGGESVTKGKPDPDMIRQVLVQLDVPAPQAIAIDDAQSGIDAAKSLKMYTIAYAPYSHKVPANADMTIDDFLEIDFDVVR